MKLKIKLVKVDDCNYNDVMLSVGNRGGSRLCADSPCFHDHGSSGESAHYPRQSAVQLELRARCPEQHRNGAAMAQESDGYRVFSKI